MIKHPSDLSCTWWSLPKSVQESLQKLTFGKQVWSFDCYKNPDNTWGFNIPHLLTFNEKFLNGTEVDLDWWFERIRLKPPELGDKLKLTISTNHLEDTTTIIEFVANDNSGLTEDLNDLTPPTFYVDLISGKSVWLCQYLQFLFGHKPRQLFLSIT
jgi:hypothetical protein